MDALTMLALVLGGAGIVMLAGIGIYVLLMRGFCG
jgi:hypothetical protein